MADIFDQWLQESPEHERLVKQEELILGVTERIWAAMEELGVSKTQLAEALGTSKPNVTQLLNGTRNLTLRTLSDIAFALNLKVKVRLCKTDDEDHDLWKSWQHITSVPRLGIPTHMNDGEEWSSPAKAA
ncbi:MAG: helix-turn-helix domain-containing protein [Pseudomonadota bacterium]|uniref:helix-turn-helix domain-containing protein n=1 Tax=Thermithiobacillus tepidarius TaxID=929 RepID=UPI00068523E6|nr:helix-turn-helix transcriptional regulator [Thermithiobacillus tepidarius]